MLYPSRRTLLKTAAGLCATPLAAALIPEGGDMRAWAADAGGQTQRFPEGFLWGVSSSAYQTEGAAFADGRAPSIWDSFARTPGRIVDGSSGDIACDHYHRYLEDVALMARAGIKVFRFSIAWPRIMPQGTGAVNAAGLAFYERLVDALLRHGIQPWPCLYHWDLPQALQDQGGWLNRATTDAFTDYALVVAGRLGDRVKTWLMLNEPTVVALFGHGRGDHAPGLRGRSSLFAAIHHQNLAQGKALAALRGTLARDTQLGTVLCLQPVKPVGDPTTQRGPVHFFDAVWNRAALDPLLLGRYPDILGNDLDPYLKPGDLALIRQPIDLLGVNYYSRLHVRKAPGEILDIGFGPPPEGTPMTGMPWPIEPEGLYEQLLDLRDRYGNPPVFLAENGADFYDWLGPEGKVEDGARIAYIRDHLAAAHRALAAGANLKGWCVWTLLDNFEWAAGYTKHFGLVAVDRLSLRRTPKASYYWYSDVIRRNGVILPAS